MSRWKVVKYVKGNGRCPIDDWRIKKLTEPDQAAVDATVNKIERTTGRLPPETLKHLKTTNLHEMKVRSRNRQIRPLCKVLDNGTVVLLCGSIKKGKIPPGDIKSAEGLLRELEQGGGYVKDYDED